MKKEVKKVVLFLTILLSFVRLEERMATQAAMNQQVNQTVSCMVLSGYEKVIESNTKICDFDDRMVLASGLVNSHLAILYKKNTPTPTPASKKSSEKEEEDNYGFGGFVVLVILAVLYFRSQKRKNTIYIKRK